MGSIFKMKKQAQNVPSGKASAARDRKPGSRSSPQAGAWPPAQEAWRRQRSRMRPGPQAARHVLMAPKSLLHLRALSPGFQKQKKIKIKKVCVWKE